MAAPAKPFSFSPNFREDRCDFCGVCFEQCPVLQLPHDRAIEEIHALIQGDSSEVLTRCTGCMACNSLCPHEANPHTLIVSRWGERYKATGIPERGRLVLPYQPSNLYALVMKHLPPDEQALVDRWRANARDLKGCDTALFAGCNLLLQPFLLDSPIYASLPIFGSLDLCCGEPLYRMGCWDVAKTVAEHVRDEFHRMGLKKVIVPCLAGYHLFKHVYPEVLGVEFPFEIVSVVEWLHGRVKRGEIHVTPLGKRAILHDSCWAKASGARLLDLTRDLLGLLGVEVVEPPHTRERALCCGMCAPVARFSLLDALTTARKRLREFDALQADFVIADCGGCNWLFAVARKLSLTRNAKPIHDLLEIVPWAAGEPPSRRIESRARWILAAAAPRLSVAYLSPRRFRIDAIAGRPVR